MGPFMGVLGRGVRDGCWGTDLSGGILLSLLL